MRQIDQNTASGPITNLCPNPSLETGTSGIGFNSGSNGTHAWQTDGGAIGSGYVRITITVAGTYASMGSYAVHVPIPTVGQVYTGSLYMRSSVANANFRATMECDDSSNTRIASVTGATVNVPANTWTRVWASGTIPAGTASITLTGYANATFAVGDTVDNDGFMLTQGSTLWPYADGSYPGWKWTGTANASTSVGMPVPPVRTSVLTNLFANPKLATGSSGWFPSTNIAASPVAGRSVDATARSGYALTWASAAGGDSYIYVGSTTAGAYAIVPTPGQTYAARVRVKQTSGTPRQFQVQLIYRDSSGALVGNSGTSVVQLTDLSIWTELAVAGLVSSSLTTAAYIQVQVRALATAAGESFAVDSVAVVNDSVPPPFYFDGSSSGGSWAGTADASVSTATVGWQARNQLPLYLAEPHTLAPLGANYDADGFRTIIPANAPPATLSIVDDPVPGTSLQQALDVAIPADTTGNRTYCVIAAQHYVPIKAGEIWTLSYYARRVQPTNAALASLLFELAATDHTNNIFTTTADTINDTWARYTHTFTAAADAVLNPSQHTGANSLYIRTNVSVASDAHYRITGIQLERGDGTGLPFVTPGHPKRLPRKTILANFNTTNNPIGSPPGWQSPTNLWAGWGMDGSHLTRTVDGNAMQLLYIDRMTSNDQEAQLTVVNRNNTFSTGVVCRYTPATSTYYGVRIGGTGAVGIFKVINGTTTILADAIVPGATDGHRIGLRCIGSTLMTLYDGAVVNTVVDTSIASGTCVGVRIDTNGATAAPTIDDFYARDLSLSDIAGPSLASVYGSAGTVNLTQAQLGPLAGRTIYTVVDRVATVPAAANSVNFGLGTAGNSGTETAVLRQDGGGNYAFRPQFTGGGGAGAAYSKTLAAPANGTRNVLTVGMIDGLTGYFFDMNGGTGFGGVSNSYPSNLSVGLGIVQPVLQLFPGVASSVTYDTPVAAFLFAGYHDPETRRRITAWLARQYGAPIPTGY